MNIGFVTSRSGFQGYEEADKCSITPYKYYLNAEKRKKKRTKSKKSEGRVTGKDSKPFFTKRYTGLIVGLKSDIFTSPSVS